MVNKVTGTAWPDERPRRDAAGRQVGEDSAKAPLNNVVKMLTKLSSNLNEARDATQVVGGSPEAGNLEFPEPEFPPEPPPIVLGKDRQTVWFLTSGGQVDRLNVADLANLTKLRSLGDDHWLNQFMRRAGDRTIFDKERASSILLGLARRAGPFDPTRRRGRGAWMTDEGPVVHLGDKLWVGGHIKHAGQVIGGYIFEAEPAIPVDLDSPLTPEEGAKFRELCNTLPFVTAHAGRLLAGWTMYATIGGAFPWQPHLYITGGTNTGKSYVYKEILSKCIPTALKRTGDSTVADVRAALGVSSLTMLLEEAETQSVAGRRNMQAVLDFIRKQGDDDAISGRASGSNRVAAARSAFALFSINVALTQAADRNRFIILTTDNLNPPADMSKKTASMLARRNKIIAKRDALHEALIDAAFGSRLLARAIRLVPQMREDARTFAKAIVARGADFRLADIYGIVLACERALTEDQPVTAKDAAADVAKLEITNTTAEQAGGMAHEWQDALAYVKRHLVTNDRVPLAHALAIITGKVEAAEGIPGRYRSRLAMLGVRIINDAVWFSNKSLLLDQALGKTQYADSIRYTLLRSKGAAKSGKPISFSNVVSHAVGLPLSLLLG